MLRIACFGTAFALCTLVWEPNLVAQTEGKPIVVRRAPAMAGPAATAPASPASASTSEVPKPSQPIVVRRTTGQMQTAVPAAGSGPFAASTGSETTISAMLDQQAIKALLDQQTADWNRGDLDAFAQGYKHAPDILFIGGSTIRRGYDEMLQRYKQSYPTRDRMGQLSFSELEVQPLGPQFATTTGRFHLERTAAGGGNAEGSFLLVLEKTAEGWKIVRDDTTSAPSKGK